MVKDIRDVTPDQHWDAFEEIWTGLMSYRYLNKTTPALDTGFADDELESMPLRHDMRNAHGGIMAAPLAIGCPEPSWNDDLVVPAPVVSFTQILDDARGVDRIEVYREVINFGRTMGFTRSKVVDAADHSRVISTSAGMGVSLGDVPDGYEAVDNPLIPVEDSPDMPRLHEVFGVTKGDDGWYRLPELTKEFSAPHAALHLGPIHIVFDITAHELVEQAAGTDRIQVESWYVMFVKPGLIGPFRCEAEAITSRSGRINVNLTLFDEGRDNRTITTGSGVFRVV
ncbi:hypothetical protein [Candidatus Poriferisocius sp.]|uniref:hypothetical protein n=1 Tax=Candidatus Poriferisocius sp. TaxID=3101276 RepID=UPI003B019C07